MIQFESLFKISYGLYIVCSGTKKHGNGYICNTFSQVTAEPAQFAVCCNKNNYTAEFINQSQAFSVSVLQQDTNPKLFGTFGYKSGRETNKIAGLNLTYGNTGVPIVQDDSIAYFECKVINTIDLGTHLMFIGTLVQAVNLNDDAEPLTYDYYRKIKKGITPKNAPSYIDKSKFETNENTSSSTKKYRCAACGYIYDDSKESLPFEELPDTWICPACGSEKADFIKIS